MTAAYRTCSVDGCEGKHQARGYCTKHYHLLKYHGTLTPTKRPLRHGTVNTYLRHKCRCADCREAARLQVAERRKRNPESDRSYYQRNRERTLASSKKWRDANLESVRARQAQRRRENPEAHVLAQARRRALVRSAERKQISPSDWRHLCDRYRNVCAYCGSAESLTLDHVIPLSRGGRHSIGNLLPACFMCNCSKGPRLLIEWRRMKSLPPP